MQKKMIEDMKDKKMMKSSPSMCKSGQDNKLLTGGMKPGGWAGFGKNGYDDAKSSGKTFSRGGPFGK